MVCEDYEYICERPLTARPGNDQRTRRKHALSEVPQHPPYKRERPLGCRVGGRRGEPLTSESSGSAAERR